MISESINFEDSRLKLGGAELRQHRLRIEALSWDRRFGVGSIINLWALRPYSNGRLS